MARSMPRRALACPVAVVVAVGTTVAACTSGDDATPPSTIATTTTTPVEPRIDDGILHIGALLPLGDTLIGASLENAVVDAVDKVNDAGGVLGNDVELTIVDEGATTATAASGIETLLSVDDGLAIDAIIGPSSSLNTIGVLDDAVAAAIVTCSPTATAISLDEFPDERLFFRTIPSDSLQAIAIAEEAEDTGASQVAIVHVDDAYGRPYASAVATAVEDRGLELAAQVAVPVADDDLDDEVQRLLASDATVAIVLGAAGDTAPFLDALDDADFQALTSVIVNDAARDPESTPVIAGLSPSLRERVLGVAPQITVETDADTDVNSDSDSDTASISPFEPQAIDCVNLIALAAVQGQSDGPISIASQMPSVSAGGSVCRSFAGCAEQLARGLQIDYRGPTGITNLNREGETSSAWFDTFTFGADGADIYEASFSESFE